MTGLAHGSFSPAAKINRKALAMDDLASQFFKTSLHWRENPYSALQLGIELGDYMGDMPLHRSLGGKR